MNLAPALKPMTAQEILEIAKEKEDICYSFKFVRVEENYLFLKNQDKHSSVLTENQQADSAGFACLEFFQKVKVARAGSTSLHLSPDPDDEKNINLLFEPYFKK